SDESRDELEQPAGSGDPEVTPEDAVDETIAELEEDFSSAELAAVPAIARTTAKAPVRKKDHATRKRSEAEKAHEDPYKAKNPAEFVRQSAGELKRVVWPTWPETVKMYSAVLVFVLIMIAIVSLLDFAFGWGLLKILGS
ncbi:MAG TPA: preprotein translocase subunit SecE, partial [Arachnia sp.]|nr:preprotein translocase subunit SecE [Arachnia sp.]